MTPPISPDRHSFGDDIQRKQHDIDALDTKRDGRVDLQGMDDGAREQLTKTYIEKVNAMQASIRRSFDTIDAMKRARTEGWREWEAQVLQSESDLSLALSAEHDRLTRGTGQPNAVVERAVAFNASVDALLAKLETSRAAAETKANAAFTPRPAFDVIRSLNQRVDATAAQRMGAAAVEHYGEDAIRNLGIALKLYQSLPKETARALFGNAPAAIDAQIAGQLANGTFERSPLAFLLEGSSAIERRVATLCEEKNDALAATQEELRTLEQRTHAHLVQLCRMAKEDAAKSTLESIISFINNLEGYPELQAQTVKTIRTMAAGADALKQKASAIQSEMLILDVALRNADTARAQNAGNVALETQLRFASHAEFGLPFEPTEEQRQSLRPSQRAALDGKADDALRLSIDEFNAFNAAHPEVDDLDRVDMLGIDGARRKQIREAQSDDVTTKHMTPFERMMRGDAHASSIITPRGSDILFGNVPGRERVIRELGSFDGGELILLEVPGSKPEHANATIAFKDASGVVRLQNGATIEQPRLLAPLQVDVGGASESAIYTTPETRSFLERTLGSDPNARVVLRSDASIRTVAPVTSLTMDPVRILDKSQLQVVTMGKDGTMKLLGADGTDEGTIDAERLRTESEEVGSDVLSSIDNHPTTKNVTSRASELHTNMQGMKLLLETAMDANANTGEAYVDQLRSYARPMQTILEDAATRDAVTEARALLTRELARCQTGDYLGRGVEQDIRERIVALDGYVKVLDDQKLLHAVHAAMEVRPDTWNAWLSKDGLIMLAAITAAVIAIVALTIMTAGTGITAVPLLLMQAGVGTAAGIAGAEEAKEGLYLYHNYWGGAAKGEYRYTDGSRIGNYARGQQVFDAEQGEYVDMSFLHNVASPYVQEFLAGFATTALTLGLSKIGGNMLSELGSLARNAKFAQALAQHSSIANRIGRYLSTIGDDAATLPANTKEFAKKIISETIDELGDEAWEGAAEAVLDHIDTRLGFLASVIVGSAKGLSPIDTNTMGYPPSMSAADIEAHFLAQGYTIVATEHGTITAETYDGHTIVAKPTTEGVPEDGEDIAAVLGLEEVMDAAKTRDIDTVRSFLASTDVPDADRIALAEAMLGRDVSDAEQEAILAAHALPGAIGTLSSAELRAKVEALATAIPNADVRRLLIESAICGTPPPPPPPPRKKPSLPPAPDQAPTAQPNAPRKGPPPPPPPPSRKKPSLPPAPHQAPTIQSNAQRKGPPPPPSISKKRDIAPTHIISPEQYTAEVQASLTEFTLLQKMASEGYAPVRRALATTDYSVLSTQERVAAYEARIQAMHRARASSGMSDTVPYSNSPTPFLEQVGRETQHGRYVGERGNTGINIFYGEALSAEALEQGPMTIWITHHSAQTSEVFRIVDQALAGSNAQMKFYIDGYTDSGNGQMVIYFDPTDTQAISRFLTTLQSNIKVLDTTLKPDHYLATLWAAQVPLYPGITMVERSHEMSWDTKVQQIFPDIQMDPYSTEFTEWKYRHKLAPHERARRYRTMPALRSDIGYDVDETVLVTLATKKDVTAVQEFLSRNRVIDNTRIILASTLLGRTITEQERAAIIAAYIPPGIVGKLTPAELRAKNEKLASIITSSTERRILIDAGICGHR